MKILVVVAVAFIVALEAPSEFFFTCNLFDLLELSYSNVIKQLQMLRP
jgi:hypothetical protein